jgi:pimeloyl-ACP methyl ester carboxylesterase
MTTIKAQEQHMTVNGVRLRYLDWGTAGKMPLVCMHGHTGQAHIWDEFAEAMSPHYHVLTLDQRGHGESEWAGTGYARDRYVEDLAAFVDALELQRFVLVGLSMGGWNSILYTPDHQERVERIIIVDIAPEPDPDYMAEFAKRPSTPLDFPSLEAAVEWTRESNPWASSTRLRKDTEDKMRCRDDGRWTWKADPSLLNFVLPDMTEPDLIARYWKAFEAIQCPLLEIRGSESPLVSDDTVRRMERVGKQFSSVDVAAAGHVVTVDKPQEFIEACLVFLGLAPAEEEEEEAPPEPPSNDLTVSQRWG